MIEACGDVTLPEIGRQTSAAGIFRSIEAWKRANANAPDKDERLDAILEAFAAYNQGEQTEEEGRVALDRIYAARRLCESDYGYLASALYSLRFIAVPKYKNPMATDSRWRVVFNPRYVNLFSMEELEFIIKHEMYHCLLGHHKRAGVRVLSEDQGNVWNIVTDCEINDDLIHEARMANKSDLTYLCAYPGRFMDKNGNPLPNGLTAEEYYDMLPEGGGSAHGTIAAGKCGTCAGEHNRDDMPAELNDEPQDGDMGDDDIERVRHDVAVKIIEHERSGQGNAPAGLARWAKGLYTPRINWRAKLTSSVRRSMTEAIANVSDYSYRKPNRRGELYNPFIMPTPVGYEPKILVMQDTSGSMSDDMLALCRAEILGVLRQFRGRIFFVAVDAQAYKVQQVSKVEQIVLRGGGGTRLDIAIDEMDKQYKQRADALIILTDCETPWPATKPTMPVIIVKVGSGATPAWPHRLIELDPKDIR